MTAWPSGLVTGRVTRAIPGVPPTALASRAVAAASPEPEPEPGPGSVAATMSGASNPGPNPCAIVS